MKCDFCEGSMIRANKNTAYIQCNMCGIIQKSDRTVPIARGISPRIKKILEKNKKRG